MDNYVRRFRFKNYEDLVAHAKHNDMLNFIVKCTNINPRLFEAAFKNPGVAIPFCVDYDKYAELCGDTYLFDYQDMEGFKEAMRERFGLIAIRKERKKLREGE